MPYQPSPHTFTWPTTYLNGTGTADDVTVDEVFYNDIVADAATSAVAYFGRTLDQAGTLYIEEDVTHGASTFTLQLEGRMTSADTFTPIALDGAANSFVATKKTSTDTDTATTPFAAYRVPIFPQMRVNVTAHGGGGAEDTPHSKLIVRLDA